MRSESHLRPILYAVAVACLFPVISWFRHSGLVSHHADWMFVSLAMLLLVLAIALMEQHSRMRRLQIHEEERENLFRLISDNAADMIAVVDINGRRLYNSPSYEKILGYTPHELANSSPFEQIHPDDRVKVMEAAEFARATGQGMRLEYRMRHKCGSWVVLESSASTIRNQFGAVERLVIVNRDITERKIAEEKLRHHAMYDPLTDLPNRALFLDRLQQALGREQRNPDMHVAVLFVDIDGFKKFNDTMGHATGDHLIVQIGQRLNRCLRNTDTVARGKSQEGAQPEKILARLGSDEFTVLLDQITDASDAMRVAKRIQEAIAPPLVIGQRELFVTACIGVSLSTGPSDAAEDLLREAGTAMYRAKTLGKSQCQFFDADMHRQAVERLKLETELHRANEHKEFRVFYQPIIQLKTGSVVGFESLLRWQPPGKEMVRPGQFILVAEETGLIVRIGSWVLREVCTQAQIWKQKYSLPSDWMITVNVSGKQLAHESFVDDVREILAQTGFDPQHLQLEITETMAMQNDDTCQILEQLKKLGLHIGIDDFGVGHSSFSRLRGFPIDLVKIDQSFVANMENDPGKVEIVRLILTVARTFGLTVIAEGVEKSAQATKLRELGCEFAQGYYYSEPVDTESAERLLVQSETVNKPLRKPATSLARAAAP